MNYIVIDLGTTNIKMSLIDGASFERVNFLEFKNEQSIMGKDIISRIFSIKKNKNKSLISKNTVRLLNEKMKVLLKENIDDLNLNKEIKSIHILGNPTMINLLLDKEIENLGEGDFSSEESKLSVISSDELSFFIKDIDVFIPPFLGGEVGSDMLGCLYTLCFLSEYKNICDLTTKDFKGKNFDLSNLNNKNILLLDIGTNIEIALIKGKHFIYTSSPGGSAFNFLGEENGLSKLLEYKEYIKEHKTKSSETNISLQNLLFARASLKASILTLFDSVNISSKDLDEVLITGNFGFSLKQDVIDDLGVFKEYKNQYSYHNNLALLGGELLSINNYKGVDEIIKNSNRIDLTKSSYYENKYLESIKF